MFQGLGAGKVLADFDGKTITSEARALPFREIDRINRFFDEFASCFVGRREQVYVEHAMTELISQRAIGICLGYKDTNNHHELRRNPLPVAVYGKGVLIVRSETQLLNDVDEGDSLVKGATVPWGESRRYRWLKYSSGGNPIRFVKYQL
jgi:hypothetical protein